MSHDGLGLKNKVQNSLVININPTYKSKTIDGELSMTVDETGKFENFHSQTPLANQGQTPLANIGQTPLASHGRTPVANIGHRKHRNSTAEKVHPLKLYKERKSITDFTGEEFSEKTSLTKIGSSKHRKKELHSEYWSKKPTVCKTNEVKRKFRRKRKLLWNNHQFKVQKLLEPTGGNLPPTDTDRLVQDDRDHNVINLLNFF